MANDYQNGLDPTFKSMWDTPTSNSLGNTNTGLEKINPTGDMGFLEQQNWGDWLQGFGSILTAFGGYKQYGLGKDTLAFNKEAFNFNKNMSIAAALAQAEGRLAEQASYGDGRDLSYLQNLVQSLRSYGTGGNLNNAIAEDRAALTNETAQNANRMGGWDSLERAAPGLDIDSELTRRAEQRQGLQNTTQQNLTANDLQFRAREQKPGSVTQPVQRPVDSINSMYMPKSNIPNAPARGNVRSADDLRFNRR